MPKIILPLVFFLWRLFLRLMLETFLFRACIENVLSCEVHQKHFRLRRSSEMIIPLACIRNISSLELDVHQNAFFFLDLYPKQFFLPETIFPSACVRNVSSFRVFPFGACQKHFLLRRALEIFIKSRALTLKPRLVAHSISKSNGSENVSRARVKARATR